MRGRCRVSLGWSWSPYIIFNPSTGVTLVFASRGFKVVILGRKLDHLVACLDRRKLAWMRAQAETLDDGQKPGFVSSISIEKLGDGEDIKLLTEALR